MTLPALTPLDGEEPLTDSFALSSRGLVIRGNPGFEECARVGRLLPVAERSLQFAMGDFINYLERRFGEQASQIIDPEAGWSEETCRVYAWIAKSIEPERRRSDRLGIRHHAAVAKLPPDLQKKWLDWAANDGSIRPRTVQHLLLAMSEAQEAERAWWLLVAAKSEEDAEELRAQLEAQGRACKPQVRRVREAGARHEPNGNGSRARGERPARQTESAKTTRRSTNGRSRSSRVRTAG